MELIKLQIKRIFNLCLSLSAQGIDVDFNYLGKINVIGVHINNKRVMTCEIVPCSILGYSEKDIMRKLEFIENELLSANESDK